MKKKIPSRTFPRPQRNAISRAQQEYHATRFRRSDTIGSGAGSVSVFFGQDFRWPPGARPRGGGMRRAFIPPPRTLKTENEVQRLGPLCSPANRVAQERAPLLSFHH